MWKPLIAIAALAAAGSANAAVTVIGGGLAQACWRAAINGERDKKSEDVCTTALETELLNNRDRAGTYVNRGVIKLRRAAYTDATYDFNKAATLKPDLGEVYVNRGAASVGQHRYKEGLDDINKALQLGLEEPEKAYFNRALAYEGLDDMKSAYFDYQKALELKPDWADPKRELARFTVRRREE
jgi:tetratricopeptide (TPR) repeat protein